MILIVLGSLITVTIVSSIINFVSAEVTSECFGSSLDHYFCVFNTSATGEKWVTECFKDKDGKWQCNALEKKATPPGVDQVIQNTINEVGPSNSNNPKNLDGLKSDKGITKNPIG
ncbi:MAG TPA: hypothetical protein VH797_03495 [Nitrososphaeraceae archaeon]